MNGYITDLAKNIKVEYCGAVGGAVAGGTGDATAVEGATIDTRGFNSIKLAVGYTTTLTQAKTLTLAIAYQTSADATTWATAVDLQVATLAATGATSGSTETGVVEHDLNLQTLGAPRYIRFNFTPEMNATATDTATVMATAILTGAASNPCTGAA